MLTDSILTDSEIPFPDKFDMITYDDDFDFENDIPIQMMTAQITSVPNVVNLINPSTQDEIAALESNSLILKITPPRKQNLIPKGTGPESRARWKDIDDNYQFMNGPAYHRMITLGISLTAVQVRQLPPLLYNKCLTMHIEMPKYRRMNTRRLNNAWAWIDQNWNIVKDLFNELVWKINKTK
jgi:hypothetical protein